MHTSPTRPQDIDTSVILWLGVAVLSLVQRLLTSVQLSQHPERIAKYITSTLTTPGKDAKGNPLPAPMGPNLNGATTAQIEAYARVIPWVMLVLSVVLIAFMCLVTWRMWKRKRWARMLLNFGGAYLTVSAIFIVVGVVTGNGTGQDPVSMLFTPGAIDGGSVWDFINISLLVLCGILAVPAVYGMYKRESNAWFLGMEQ